MYSQQIDDAHLAIQSTIEKLVLIQQPAYGFHNLLRRQVY
jgi:hypothetical protein